MSYVGSIKTLKILKVFFFTIDVTVLLYIVFAPLFCIYFYTISVGTNYTVFMMNPKR